MTIISDVLIISYTMRKKIDNRIRVLIENGVAQGKRSMFVVVGDKARDQVHNRKGFLKKRLS